MKNSQQNPLSLDDIARRDSRAGHFIVDIIAGADPDEAAGKYFGNTRAADGDGALREAEERGYLRGLNDAAARKMNEPALYEQLPPMPANAPHGSPRDDTFMPPEPQSIWDTDPSLS